jgi:signal transduction histidine kinase
VIRSFVGVNKQTTKVQKERLRIAQDLHDELGTGLTEINLLSTVATSPSCSTEEVKDCLKSIQHKSLQLVKVLDEIVWSVNPKNDSLSNLIHYLCLYSQEFLRTASIRCRLDVQPDMPDLPLNAEQRHALLLVTKEALTNAAKHSAASEIWLRVTLRDSFLTVIVEDNGHGFDDSARQGDRNGLDNIENRMRDLGGSGLIRGAVGQGASVELRLAL